jgi:branched-chain amino acid transport system permease protein
MIGGYLGYTFLTLPWPEWVPAWATITIAIAAAIAVAIIMGLLIERLTLRPLVGQPVLAVIMMTIALGVLLDGLATLIWGGEYKTYHGVLPTLTLRVGEISLPSETLIGAIVAVVVVAILMILFRYTKSGLAMMATAEDEQVVQSAGIRVTTVYALSWVIACVTGVVSGILLGGVSGVMIPMSEVGLKAFAVVLLGGIDSIGGAIVAGIIVGVLENLAAGYLDPLLPYGGMASIFPFIVMIIVLIFRPHGLFGLRRIERI